MLNNIRCIVTECRQARGVCHIMLTGGQSAVRLYSVWENSIENDTELNNIHFYFGDERCVPPNHPESNFRVAMETLFPRGLPDGTLLHRMEGYAFDHEVAADTYSSVLPERIDILLLSIGEDGHIASLFPHSAALKEKKRRVVPITGPKVPYQRLTITPSVIRCARHVMVMAIGQQKRALYEEARTNPSDIDALPARLVLDKAWIFGE